MNILSGEVLLSFEDWLSVKPVFIPYQVVLAHFLSVCLHCNTLDLFHNMQILNYKPVLLFTFRVASVHIQLTFLNIDSVMLFYRNLFLQSLWLNKSRRILLGGKIHFFVSKW